MREMNYILGTAWETGVHDMETWSEEFKRLSDIEREAIDKWIAGEINSNAVINAAEATKAFLIQYMAAGEPERDQEMP